MSERAVIILLIFVLVLLASGCAVHSSDFN